jgi:hypothetical protein
VPDQERPNGAHEFPRAATPDISSTLEHAAAGDPVSANDFLAAINKLAEKVGGDGNGGPPKKMFFGLTGGGWTKLVLGIFVTAATTAGAWVLIVRDTLKDHGAKIESHESQPMHKAASDAVDKLDGRLGKVEKAVENFSTTQTQVILGIEELKKENLDEIESERDELKAENRRLERAARRNR